MNPNDGWSSRLVVRLGVIVPFFLVLTSHASGEWKEKVLYSFQGGAEAGSVPAGGVVFDKQGNLYGVTSDGGGVYQLKPPAKKGEGWTESVLYVFKGNTEGDGATPEGGLIIDSAGNLYGTTAYGGTGNCALLGISVGCGTVYELSPPATKGGSWNETVLYRFPTNKNGYYPWGDLVFDGAGNLYGATLYGGGKGYNNCDKYYGYCGTVFELSPPKTKGGKWSEKVLHSFASGTDGANPNGGLVFDSNGNLYGTTYGGGDESGECGPGGCGTAFELNPPTVKDGVWTEKMLHRFGGPTDGERPAAGMILGAMGRLYGTTFSGGTVFSLTPPTKESQYWKKETLYTFNENDGPFDPYGALIFDANGNLYGTTNVGNAESLQGSVFRLRPPDGDGGHWSFTVIYGFLGPPDGDFPAASLVLDKNGNLYSTTQAGGTGTACGYGGCGTVFEVSP
jgi:hypothetical protein